MTGWRVAAATGAMAVTALLASACSPHTRGQGPPAAPPAVPAASAAASNADPAASLAAVQQDLAGVDSIATQMNVDMQAAAQAEAQSDNP